MGRSSVLLLVSCATALGLAACGGGDDEAEVREVVTGYASAVAGKDYQRICDELIDPKLGDQVEEVGLPCELAFKQGLDDVRKPTLTIGAIAVDGDRATADVTTGAQGQRPSKDRLTLSRSGDAWRISALSAAPPTATSGRGRSGRSG